MGLTDTILNPIFMPLLSSLGPLWALLLISFFISLLMTLIYKWVTNQDEMKRLKEEMKEHQKLMKETKDSPEKMVELQKKAMSANMEYMRHSFKPTLITFIPIILIFGWLGAHLAYEPIMPGDDFTLRAEFVEPVAARLVLPEGLKNVGNATQDAGKESVFTIEALREGEYFIDLEVDDKPYSKEIIVSTKQRYAPQIQTYEGAVKSIAIDYKKLVILPIGYKDWFGWLGVYILCSLVFSLVLRKAMKLY